MTQFSTEVMAAIEQILQRWADEQLRAALSSLSSENLQSSGRLRNSLISSISIEAGVKAKASIQYIYYGTILDRDFIRFGKKGISTSNIERWLKKDGMAKMGGYRGTAKSEARQIRDMAWKIRRSWQQHGGRKGRPWNFRGNLQATSEDLMNQIATAFQSQTIASILSTLNQ